MPWRSVSGREGKGFLPGSWATLSREGKMPSHFSPCQAVISFCVGLAHTRRWTSPGQGWMPHREIKERLSLGLPWWSSGWDSVLQMQGTQVSALVGGTKIPHGMQCGQKKTKQTSQKKRERERLDQGAETPTQFICLPISLSFLGKVKPLTLKLSALRQPWWNALWLMSDISFVGFTPETSETAPTLSYCVCLLWLLNTIHLVRDLQISLNLISPVYQHLGNKCPWQLCLSWVLMMN